MYVRLINVNAAVVETHCMRLLHISIVPQETHAVRLYRTVISKTQKDQAGH
jgi:hypothetical protein